MNRIVLLLITFLAVSCFNRETRVKVAETTNEHALNTVRFAKGFSLQVRERNVWLTVRNPWQHASGVEFTYLLSDTLTASRILGERSWAIKTPVHSVVCLSTTHIGFIAFLNKVNSVSGISGKDYVVNREIRTAIEKGFVEDVGYDENLNYDLLLNLKPDVVFAYGVSVAITSTIRKLNELGIPVILIGEYLEQEPLAKMEWVKLFAAFYQKEQEASQQFAGGLRDSLSLHFLERQIEPLDDSLNDLANEGTEEDCHHRERLLHVWLDLHGIELESCEKGEVIEWMFNRCDI